MFSRINVISIICLHLGTLYDLKSEKIRWSEVGVFYILPFIVSFISVYFSDHVLTITAGDLFFDAFIIASGFMINVLVMLVAHKQKCGDLEEFSEKADLIEETYLNVSFALLTSLMIIILTGISLAIHDNALYYSFLKELKGVLTSLIYALSFIFLHALLMIIKRIEKIIRD